MTSPIEKLSKLSARSPLGEAKDGARAASAPMNVYLLADHLDAALAAGEDLLNQSIAWQLADPREEEQAAEERESVRSSLRDIRSLELTLMSRILRAREHAEEVGRRDQRFRLVASLFHSGTVPLLDAVADLGDTTRHNFETGDVITAYLRSHGLLGLDAAAPIEGTAIVVSDAFLVAGRVTLGPLLDLAATFLDALETHYDLFVVDTTDEADLLAAEEADRAEASALPSVLADHDANAEVGASSDDEKSADEALLEAVARSAKSLS